MIKMIGTGNRGTQDPSTMQPILIDGAIVADLGTIRKVATLLSTATGAPSTGERIALARSVDRRRQAAIVNRRAGDAVST